MSRPRSLAIVGSAVARIVWSSTAGSIATTIAANAILTDGLVSEAVVIGSSLSEISGKASMSKA